MALDAMHVTATLTDGSRREIAIDHCVGSQLQPMTDAQLGAKFLDQCAPVLGRARAEGALASLWRMDDQEDLRALVAACTA
jgi:2-methylcitrate dehydratase